MITIKIMGTENEPHEIDTDFAKRVSLMEIIELTSHTPLTVEESMSVYCNKYGSRIEQYDGSDESVPFANGEEKYFFYHYKNGDRRLIDIHIQKPNGDDICIKHDLSHQLEDGDMLSFGVLIC